MTQENFITELKYIRNVSPKTLELYGWSFKAFDGAMDTKATAMARIAELREKGNKAITVNTYLRCLNSYLRWQHFEHGKELVKLPKLKEESLLIPTFSPEQISRIINWKPIRGREPGLKALALAAIDTGMRIDELLSLRRTDVNLESLTLRVVGKGNKHRLVPMSIELRKVLYRHLGNHNFDRVFCTQEGGKLSQRNILRDFKRSCRELHITGVRCSFHSLRHSFSANYIRSGGNLYYLQSILGHSSISTTEKYIKGLGIADIGKDHSSRSLLSR